MRKIPTIFQLIEFNHWLLGPIHMAIRVFD